MKTNIHALSGIRSQVLVVQVIKVYASDRAATGTGRQKSTGTYTITLQVDKVGLIQGTIRSTDRPNYPHESRMHNVRAGITAIYYRQEFSLRLSNFICGCCTDLVLTTHRDKTMSTQLSRVGSRFTPGERSPSTHCTGGWMGHRVGLDTEATGKILPLPGIEL
jgi:hypothetical protein